MDIELSEAVAAIRGQLLEAARSSAGSNIAFTVGPIEMEFVVELRRESTATGGVKAWVVSADVTGVTTKVQTHKVKVSLTAKKPDGSDLLISDMGSLPAPSADGDTIGR